MRSTTVPALVMRRVYRAAPQLVYEAWTKPELAKQFLCPDGVTIPDITMDVRVGGAYQIVMQKEDGERLTVRGTYRDVQPARRLQMTWKWDEDDPKDAYDTILTIEFAPADGGTELTLTHVGFPKEENRTNHEHGWTSILDNLERL
jgi:uncharacterized protein YndB with AHSA1/START domain